MIFSASNENLPSLEGVSDHQIPDLHRYVREQVRRYLLASLDSAPAPSPVLRTEYDDGAGTVVTRAADAQEISAAYRFCQAVARKETPPTPPGSSLSVRPSQARDLADFLRAVRFKTAVDLALVYFASTVHILETYEEARDAILDMQRALDAAASAEGQAAHHWIANPRLPPVSPLPPLNNP